MGDVNSKLEPEAVHAGFDTDQAMVEHSKAISLKRIADFMESVGDSKDLCDFIEAVVKDLKQRGLD